MAPKKMDRRKGQSKPAMVVKTGGWKFLRHGIPAGTDTPLFRRKIKFFGTEKTILVTDERRNKKPAASKK